MADTAGLRARNSAFWTQAAPGWIRHADFQDDVGRPLGAVALTRLNPRPGERVLDVGCGCGGTTAELAGAVGPTGAALGVDLAASMVAAAQTRFPPDRHRSLRFAVADIETANGFADTPFDAAYSRMALMLLADPIAGCGNIRRALRPGGRLAATVFRDSPANPWLPLAVLGAAPHVGALPPLPVGDEPGPFAFADPARVRRILIASGFHTIVIEPHDVIMAAPDDPDTVAEWLIEIGPAGAAYRAATMQQQTAARAAAAGLLARFRQPHTGYRIPAGLWLITASASTSQPFRTAGA